MKIHKGSKVTKYFHKKRKESLNSYDELSFIIDSKNLKKNSFFNRILESIKI